MRYPCRINRKDNWRGVQNYAKKLRIQIIMKPKLISNTTQCPRNSVFMESHVLWYFDDMWLMWASAWSSPYPSHLFLAVLNQGNGYSIMDLMILHTFNCLEISQYLRIKNHEPRSEIYFLVFSLQRYTVHNLYGLHTPPSGVTPPHPRTTRTQHSSSSRAEQLNSSQRRIYF